MRATASPNTSNVSPRETITMETLRKIVANSDAYYSVRIEPLVKALQEIVEWKMPMSGRTWEDGTPMSFEVAFGSQGARNYIREIAAKALVNFAANSSSKCTLP